MKWDMLKSAVILVLSTLLMGSLLWSSVEGVACMKAGHSYFYCRNLGIAWKVFDSGK